MRRALVVAALLLLTAAAPATAYYRTATTAERVAAFEAAAVSYWGGAPSCGVPPVTFADILPAAGRAFFPSCSVELDWGWWTGNAAAPSCEVLVHEVGHLVLGARAFADANPDDPAHSPDPSNVMYGGGPFHARVPQCEAREVLRRTWRRYRGRRVRRVLDLTYVAGVVVEAHLLPAFATS